MYLAEPPPRLRDFAIGKRVLLAGIERVLVIKQIRDDGYIDLDSVAGSLSVTAAPCHLAVLDAKQTLTVPDVVVC